VLQPEETQVQTTRVLGGKDIPIFEGRKDAARMLRFCDNVTAKSGRKLVRRLGMTNTCVTGQLFFRRVRFWFVYLHFDHHGFVRLPKN
jgi:hypothetical protein